jgi:hypothetical protein
MAARRTVDDAFWQALVDADGAVPADRSLDELTPVLLGFLGSPDPVRRDHVAYFLLATWIFRGEYDSQCMRAMTDHLRRNLVVGLGETGTDSVFLRSFSALVLAALAYYDAEQPFLDEEGTRLLLDEAIAYAKAERDLRGYVQEKGWAHSVAHTADLLGALGHNPRLGAAELERLLTAIALRASAPFVYLYNEDDRLALAVIEVLARNLLESDTVAAWVSGLAQPAGRPPWREALFDDEQVEARHNVHNLLRSLYLRLSVAEDPPPVTAALLPTLAAALCAMVGG